MHNSFVNLSLVTPIIHSPVYLQYISHCVLKDLQDINIFFDIYKNQLTFIFNKIKWTLYHDKKFIYLFISFLTYISNYFLKFIFDVEKRDTSFFVFNLSVHVFRIRYFDALVMHFIDRKG